MDERRFENQLFALTTVIFTEYRVQGIAYSANASGFYYTDIAVEEENADIQQWRIVNGQWLITNRHVIFPVRNDKNACVEKIVFCLREIENGSIKWIPIVLNQKEIRTRVKMHKDPHIDVVAIDVSSFIQDKMKEYVRKKKQNNLVVPAALTNLNLPENQPMLIDVTSDVIVASYPKMFYDEFNKFPIVKSGIIASAWGFCFKGLPIFEIDAQLFPGSSGGLVLSKPTNIAVFEGGLHHSDVKQFVFLGVYSGEYTWDDIVTYPDGKKKTKQRSYGLGNVWYSSLIPEIIQNGEYLSNL